MEQFKLRSYLEAITNLAVLLVAAVVLYTCTSVYLAGKQQHVQLEGLQKGRTLAGIPGHAYGDSPQTLLMALNPQCGFCNESLPFYDRLIKQHRANGSATQIIAVFETSASDIKQYLQQQHLDVDTAVGTNFSALNVSATPTIILVDNTGKILDFWVGKLSKEDEQQVLKAIGESGA